MSLIDCVAAALFLFCLLAVPYDILRWNTLKRGEKIKNLWGKIMWVPVHLTGFLGAIHITSYQPLIYSLYYTATLFVIAFPTVMWMEWLFRFSDTRNKWVFKCFQWKLKNFMVPDHDLLAYPFMLFVELELPNTFKEGGMKAVRESVYEYPKRLTKMADNIVDGLAKVVAMRSPEAMEKRRQAVEATIARASESHTPDLTPEEVEARIKANFHATAKSNDNGGG